MKWILLALLVPSVALAEWRQDKFLVGAFCPGYQAGRIEALVALDAGGFDYVQNLEHSFDGRFSRGLVRALDSLATARPGFGLRAILYNGNAADAARFSTRLDAAQNLPAIVGGLATGGPMNGRSVLGWGLWDEPANPKAMEAIHRLTVELRRSPATRDRLPFVNLFPIYACHNGDFRSSYSGSCADAYDKYLEDYLARFDGDALPAPVLSFDHYPEWSNAGRRDYFQNLGLAARAAQRHSRAGYRIPLWVVIQLSHYRSRGKAWEANPSWARTRWQAWCALAYGAKSIGYWTVAPVYDDQANEGWGPGVLGFDHRPTARMNDAAALNRELHAFGATLFGLESVAVFQRGDSYQDVADDERPGSGVYGLVRAIAGDAPDQALVGYLKAPGGMDDYLLVVNKDLAKSRAFKLTLDGPADRIEEIVAGKARSIATSTNTLAVESIAPASARLYRLVTPFAEHLKGVTEVRTLAGGREYRVPRGWLKVDTATGARRWAVASSGTPDPGARWNADGVLKAR